MKTLKVVYRKLISILNGIIDGLTGLWQSRATAIANLHHIGLNVTNEDTSISFYEKYFGVKKVRFNAEKEALLADKVFLLLNPVDKAPTSNKGTSLWHMGWSGVDAQHEFDWRVKEGIRVHTPVTSLEGDHWMYFLGPDNEILEVYTRKKNTAFEHIHLLASDVDKTMGWFKSYLGLDAKYKKALQSPRGFRWNFLTVNDIDIVVFGRPASDKEKVWWLEKAFKPTDGAAIDHIGFSFRVIDPIFNAMKSKGADIVEGININPIYRYKSFTLRGPDQLRVEIVEEKNGFKKEFNVIDKI